MQRIRNQLTSIVFASMLGFTSIFASGVTQAYDLEEEVSTEAIIADALAVRPLMLGAVLIGTFTFVVSSPFSAIGGNFKKSFDQLVVAPSKYTFVRPLGHMGDEPSRW